jgi:hypothetical protein
MAKSRNDAVPCGRGCQGESKNFLCKRSGGIIRVCRLRRGLRRTTTTYFPLNLDLTGLRRDYFWDTAILRNFAGGTNSLGSEVAVWRVRLQWRDIDFFNRTILVRTGKTDAGQRSILMNVGANELILHLRERAKAFEGIDGQHHVFPARENGHVDPTRHQTSFRTAWRNLTRAIQCPTCGKSQKLGEKCADKKCAGEALCSAVVALSRSAPRTPDSTPDTLR